MSAPIFSRRVLIGWVGAAVATFAVSLYFMGRQGEPGGTDAVGPSAYSRSAIGHAGIADTLQRLGVPVVKSRNNSADKLGKNGLLILAEPRPTTVSEPALRALLDARAVLLVLPKWTGRASEKKPGWLGTAEEKPPAQAQWALNLVAGGGEVVRERQTPIWGTNVLGRRPQLETPVQLMRSVPMRAIIAGPSGILLGELNKNRAIWVLADPDVIANHGIGQGENAALALAIINRLRGRGRVRRDHPRLLGAVRYSAGLAGSIPVCGGDLHGCGCARVAVVGDHGAVRGAANGAAAAQRRTAGSSAERRPADHLCRPSAGDGAPLRSGNGARNGAPASRAARAIGRAARQLADARRRSARCHG
jgi:hypothetical protein